MKDINGNEKNLPSEVFGAISQLMQSLEKMENKFIKDSEEENNENS